jgi:hypothetical protein
VRLSSHASLCLTIAQAKNKYGSNELIVDACAAPAPPAQLFALNNGTLTTLGGADMRIEHLRRRDGGGLQRRKRA